VNFRQTVAAVTFLAIFSMAARMSFDTDTWWHLGAGEWILEHGQLLRADPFSSTRLGQVWEYPGWLAQVTLALVQRWSGLGGLNLLTAVVVVVSYALIWPRLSSGVLQRSFMVLSSASAAGIFWAARPHIFSFLLTAGLVASLELARTRNLRWLVIPPALVALWSNLHGGYAIAFIVLAAHVAGAGLDAGLVVGVPTSGMQKLRAAWLAARPYGLALAACFPAAIINPFHVKMLSYPLRTISIGALQDFIQEWQSPNFHAPEAMPFLFFILLSMLVLALSRERKLAHELLLVMGLAAMSLMAARNIATFCLACLPALDRHASSAFAGLAGWRSSRPLAAWAQSALNSLIIFMASLLAAVRGLNAMLPLPIEQHMAMQVPTEAAAYLDRARPPGELFNSYNWGGYVIWELHPAYRSFVDGRTDLFDDELLQTYLVIWSAEPGWEAELSNWNVRVLLVEPYSPLAKVAPSQGWSIRYQDQQAVVLVREP
jgi:hypothetical protein